MEDIEIIREPMMCKTVYTSFVERGTVPQAHRKKRYILAMIRLNQ